MRQSWTGAIALGVFIAALGGLQAAPQKEHNTAEENDEGWYTTRDSFYHAQDWRTKMFERIRADVDRIESKAFAGKEDYQLNKTKDELTDLQKKLSSGQYDEQELDEVTAELGRAVADKRLPPRDQQILNDDLSRLRDYREHHENWR